MASKDSPQFRLRLSVVLLSAALFIASLCLPAILFHDTVPDGRGTNFPRIAAGTEDVSGLGMLLSSIFGPSFGNFAGLANPLLLLCWILLLARKARAALICSIAAALLTLQTFQLYSHPMMLDEGGVVQGTLIHPLAGYYFWIASILITCLASFYWRSAFRQKRSATSNPKELIGR